MQIDGPPYLVYNPGPKIRKNHGLLGHDSMGPVFYTWVSSVEWWTNIPNKESWTHLMNIEGPPDLHAVSSYKHHS